MRRIIALILMILITLFTFTGCDVLDYIIGGTLEIAQNIVGTTNVVARRTTKKFVKALNEKDKKTAKSLFAKNIVKKCKNFDEDLDKAFEYYGLTSGKVEYSENSGDATMGEHSVYFTYYDADVRNGKKHFTVSLEVCTTDENDEDNEGIWLLYITDETKYNEKEDIKDDYEDDYEDSDDFEVDDSHDYGIFLD